MNQDHEFIEVNVGGKVYVKNLGMENLKLDLVGDVRFRNFSSKKFI